MKKVFKFDNYKDFLNNYVNAKTAPRGLRTQLAKAMGCQTAYMTQVLNGKAELMEDHACRLVAHLELPKLEADYLMLLVRYARARTPELRLYLDNERREMIARSEEVHRRLTSAPSDDETFIKTYFGSWICSTIHIATSSENYQTIEALSTRLGLPKKIVSENLKFLATFGKVKKNGDRWVYAGGPLHLDRANPISRGFQAQRRWQVVKSILQGTSSQDLHLSSVFTLDKKTFEELRAEFLDALERAHKKIQAGGTQELYAISVDLFEVA